MKTLNVPVSVFLGRFHMPGKSDEQLRRAAAIAADVLASDKVELDIINNNLHIFTEELNVHKALLFCDMLPMSVLGTLLNCFPQVHGPGCHCGALAPSKRQGLPANTRGVKA